ncbi:MAG: SurA N-terminal domain-containing protein [Bacillota bacterium]|jgi:hypothetical protein
MARAQRRRKVRELREKERKGIGARGGRGTRIVALALVGAFLVGAGGWGAYTFLAGASGHDDVLYVVNGHEITRAELDRRVNVIRYLYGIGESGITPDLRQALLEDLVDGYLVAAEAARRGITVDLAEARRLDEQFEMSLKVVHGSPLAITAARLRLRVRQSDVAAYRDALILNNKLYQAVTAEVTVTEEDILALYAELKETMDMAGLSLEEARDRLADEALQKKRGEVYLSFLAELRSRADIAGPG